MKYGDLVAGKTVEVDAGFTCMGSGKHIVQQNSAGEFYLRCAKGDHMLDGQIDEDGELIGIIRGEDQ